MGACHAWEHTLIIYHIERGDRPLELFKILGTVALNNSDANKQIEDTTGRASSLGEKFKTGITTVAKWGAAVTAAATAATAAVWKFAESAASATDTVDKMSQKIGISREAYQELDFICSQSGTSVDTLQMGVKTLTNQMQAAADGTDSAVAMFEKLGVSIYDTNGELKDQETMMWETMDALQRMENQTEKAALANDLLGRSGTELMPLLNGTAGSLEAMREQAHELGLILSDEAVDAGVLFTDTVDQTKRAFAAIATELGVGVMPTLQKFLEQVQSHLPVIRDTIFGAVETAVSKFKALKDWMSDIVSYIREAFQPIFEDLKTAFFAVKDALQPYIDALAEYVSSGEAAQDFTMLLKEAIDFVAESYETLKGFIFDVIQGFQDAVAWCKEHETGLTMAAIAVGTLTTAIIAYNTAMAIKNAGGIIELAQLAATAIGLGALTVAQTAQTVATTIATAATSAFGAVMAFVTSPITLVVLAIGALIAIIVLLVKHWDTVKEVASNVWEWIKNVWSSVASWFKEKVVQPVVDTFNSLKEKALEIWSVIGYGLTSKIETAIEGIKNLWEYTLKPIFNGIVDFVSGVFTGNWERAWNGVKGIFSGVVNGIITGAETMVNSAIGAINGIINGINALGVVDAIANVFGADGIPLIPTVSIPRLEKGGILEKGKIGFLEGNGAEAVVPLDQNRAWISKVAKDMNLAVGGTNNQQVEELKESFQGFVRELPDILTDAFERMTFDINNREFARLVKAVN